jgi:MFS family permease
MKKGNVRKLLGILACAFLYSSMYLLPYIKYIFYDAIVEATGFTNTQIGFTLTVYIVASIISTIPSGWLADKYEPKKLLIISGAGHVCASILALIFIRSYAMTLVCFFLMGITSLLAFWSPVFKAVSQVGSKDEQGKWYGWFEGFNGIGSMVFNFGALYVFGKVTSGSMAALRSVYIFYICSSLVATLMVLFLYKPSEEALASEAENKPTVKKKATNKEIFAVLKMPRVWLFSLMVFGIYGFYCGSSYLTPYFSTVLGVSVVFSGSLATLKNYGTRLVGAPIAGHICDKIGRLKFLTIAGAITIILMVAFMMMPESKSALVPIMILMFALALVNVSMKGVQFSALNEVGVDQSVNGMAIGLATLIGFNIPDLVLHPIFGAILDKYEPTVAYKIIFGCLLGMLILAFVVGLILFLLTKKTKVVENVKVEE